MEQILNYLQAHLPETLSILAVVLYAVGSYLKMTPKIKDWSIPYILMLIGALCSCGIQHNIEVITILQGAACGILAVGANQLKVQYKKKDENKEQPQ
ncbi:Uncharacterised protein [Clostridium baratii]|uniref:phage holin family protein n=1 Tax=Clostridium baratii TaxID=1561 RepID=UPI0006C53258|nr:phage holin family protein [Clostridium baratii]CUP05634.1 Uncharacterised protein [Clostridium baratii]